MPAMVRPEGKAKKIAYAILGVPDAMKGKKSSKLKHEDDVIAAQEVVRMR